MVDTYLRENLLNVEEKIKESCPARNEWNQYRIVKNYSGKDKEKITDLLRERQRLLDRMLLCTPAEIVRMREVNARLLDLSNKLYDKTYSLYRALLLTGYDPEFDDDIMIQGYLKYIVDFWCEVRVTHQLLTDLKGERYSLILNRTSK